MDKLKIIFRSDRERIEEDLHFFLFTDNYFKEDFLDQIAQEYPKLHKDLAGRSDQEGKKILGQYLDKFYQDKKDNLLNSLNSAKDIWKPIEQEVGEILSDQFKTDWGGVSDLTAVVGITETCSRDLDAKIFQFFYLQYPFQAVATILHEITHFIYFKKWSELFPQDHHDTKEAPHKYWHLSEILVSIFNSDERLKSLVPDADVYGHPEYRNMPSNQKLMNMSVHGFFEQKYLKFKLHGKGIEEYLEFCRSEIEELNFR